MTPEPPSSASAPSGGSSFPYTQLLLVGALALILWSLFRELGPWIAWVGAFAMLWPRRREAWAADVLRVLALLATLWILHKTRTVVYPLLFALLIAYWLDPIVDRLERRRVPRSVGALMALLPALALFALFALYILPVLVSQLGQLFGEIPDVYRSIYEKVYPWLQQHLPSGATGQPIDWWSPIAAQWGKLLQGVWGGAQGLTRGVGAVLSVLGMAVLAPILSYYLLADFDKLRAWTAEQIPPGRRDQALRTMQDLESTLSSYFRGQVLVSLCVGILLTVGFLVIGMPYAVLLGFVGGLLNLIPVLGFWVSVAFFVPAAVLSGEAGPMIFRLAIVLALESVIESQVLTPRIVGRAVGLNPAVILVSVLAFGALLGPVGVLLAVPAAAMARTLLARSRLTW